MVPAIIHEPVACDAVFFLKLPEYEHLLPTFVHFYKGFPNNDFAYFICF